MTTTAILVLVLGVVGVPILLGLIYVTIDMARNPDKYKDPM
jgi:hypothetical protein